MQRIAYPYYIPRRGAQFESREHFLRETKAVVTTSDRLEYSGVVLTQVGKDKIATTKEEMHTFVIGETGCGKTRRVILPTIRLMAKSGQSMIITDPKGEIYKKTAKALKDKGYVINVLNFRDPSRSDRWNPLQLVESLYHSGSMIGRDKALQILEDIALILGSSIESEKDRFWENEAKKVFIGISLFIMQNCPKGSLTFENISIVSKEIVPVSRRGMTSFRPNNAETFKAMLDDIPKNSLLSENLFGYLNAADDTRKSITAVFEGMIGFYVNQEALLDLFSTSDFSIEDIGKRRTALFMIIPDDSAVMYPIATVFVKQMYSALINLADSNQNGILTNRVSFILDEFANFATIPDVESMLTASRSRGISFVLVCQSMEQLQKKYTQEGSEILMSNCRVWVYMSCRNLYFLKRLIELNGERISQYTGESRPLISLSELQHFRMGEVLIYNDRSNPVRGYLPDYSEYDFGEIFGESPLPPSHDAAERTIIDMDGAIQNAKLETMKVKMKRRQDSLEEEETSITEAGASLIDRFGTTSNSKDDTVEAIHSSIDIDKILANLDRKIAEIEAAEREAEENERNNGLHDHTGSIEEVDGDEQPHLVMPDWLSVDDGDDDESEDDNEFGEDRDEDDVELDNTLLARLRRKMSEQHDDEEE